jgi:hypothetical protein
MGVARTVLVAGDQPFARVLTLSASVAAASPRERQLARTQSARARGADPPARLQRGSRGARSSSTRSEAPRRARA